MVASMDRQFFNYFHFPLSHYRIRQSFYQHKINISIDIFEEGTKNEMAIHMNNILTPYFKISDYMCNKIGFLFLLQLR